MASYAFFMERHQQGYGDLLVKLPSVTTGTFAAFTLVPVGEHIKIMVADPATYDVFVPIVVKTHRRKVALIELPASQVHDPFLDLFLLGPC
jgi:hypothetical protein